MSPILCDSDFAYANGLMNAWQSEDTLVLVEHDMEYLDELVDGLLACSRPLCGYPYLIWSPTLKWHYAACNGWGRRLEHNEEWADHCSLGFVKVAPAARVEALGRAHWKWVEHCVHRGVGGRVIEPDNPHHISRTGDDGKPLAEETPWQVLPPATGPWHIHWPAIEHHHPYPA